MRVVYDIETDGLDNCTVIWCCVCKDIDTGKLHVFTDAAQFTEFAVSVTLWIGHNVISFDNYWIEKLWGYRIPVDKVIDTVVLSRMFNRYWIDKGTKKITSTRTLHSLDSWGERLGFPKQDFKEFDKYSETMLEYCKNDVELTHRVYEALMKENR